MANHTDKSSVEDKQSGTVFMSKSEVMPGEPKKLELPELNLANFDSLYFERTSCYGTCPVYKAKIYSDGSMVYTGRVFVEKVGTYKATVSPDLIIEMLGLMREVGFAKMLDVYDTAITDVPSTITEFWGKLDGDVKHKKVMNRADGPQQLRILEKHIDFMIHRAQNWEKISE